MGQSCRCIFTGCLAFSGSRTGYNHFDAVAHGLGGQVGGVVGTDVQTDAGSVLEGQRLLTSLSGRNGAGSGNWYPKQIDK